MPSKFYTRVVLQPHLPPSHRAIRHFLTRQSYTIFPYSPVSNSSLLCKIATRGHKNMLTLHLFAWDSESVLKWNRHDNLNLIVFPFWTKPEHQQKNKTHFTCKSTLFSMRRNWQKWELNQTTILSPPWKKTSHHYFAIRFVCDSVFPEVFLRITHSTR